MVFSIMVSKTQQMKKYFTIFVVAIIMNTAFSGCAEYYYPERHYDRHPQYHEGHYRHHHDNDRDDHRGRGDRDDRRRDRDDH